jgi:hypothetical protein
MVNHYATLLLNLPGTKAGGSASYLTARDYNKINLPNELKSFYNILFPPYISNYQAQFLAYNYLRLVQSSGLTEAITSYDSRVAYDLDALSEYFRTYKNSAVTTNNPKYNLLVVGKYTPANNNYYYNSFTVNQIGSTNTLTVFSNIDHLYLNGALTSQSVNSSVVLPVVQDPTSSTSSKAIPVGVTGLSFILTGNIGSLNNYSNSTWTFTAEAPLKFSFSDTLTALKLQNSIVEQMLNYRSTGVAGSDENIWNTHFNDIYRFAGLLNCYVKKVNQLI